MTFEMLRNVWGIRFNDYCICFASATCVCYKFDHLPVQLLMFIVPLTRDCCCTKYSFHWWEQVAFRWDFNIHSLYLVRRTARVDIYSVTSLKQQSTCGHHAVQSDAIWVNQTLLSLFSYCLLASFEPLCNLRRKSSPK